MQKLVEERDTYKLDEETIILFREIKQQIQLLNAQGQGVLALYLRQHKLDGQWVVADNGIELQRIDAQTINHA